MHSKFTEHYKLPKWEPNDHPDFLTDMNGAYETIDKGMFDNRTDSAKLREDVDAMAVTLTETRDLVDAMKTTVDNMTSIEDNPVFKTLKDRVDAIDTSLTGLTATVADNKADADKKISDVNKLIATINTTITAIDNTLAEHRSELDEHHNNIEAILQTNNLLRDRMGQIETNARVLETQIDKNTRDIIALQSKNAEQDGNIANLTTRVGVINTEQETQRGEINVIKTSASGSAIELGQVKTGVQDNKTAIQSLNQRVTQIELGGGGSGTVDADISGLVTRVDAVEAKNNSQDTKIASLEVTDGTLSTRLTSVETTVSGQATTVASLGSKVDTLKTTSAVHTSDIDMVESRVDDLETAVSPVTDGTFSFTDIKNKVEALEIATGGAEGDLTQLTNKVTRNSASVDRLNSAVGLSTAVVTLANPLLDRLADIDELLGYDTATPLETTPQTGLSQEVVSMKSTVQSNTEDVTALKRNMYENMDTENDYGSFGVIGRIRNLTTQISEIGNAGAGASYSGSLINVIKKFFITHPVTTTYSLFTGIQNILPIGVKLTAFNSDYGDIEGIYYNGIRIATKNVNCSSGVSLATFTVGPIPCPKDFSISVTGNMPNSIGNIRSDLSASAYYEESASFESLVTSYTISTSVQNTSSNNTAYRRTITSDAIIYLSIKVVCNLTQSFRNLEFIDIDIGVVINKERV